MPEYKHTKKIHSTKSMWGLGKGWTACASENSHKLEQGTYKSDAVPQNVAGNYR